MGWASAIVTRMWTEEMREMVGRWAVFYLSALSLFDASLFTIYIYTHFYIYIYVYVCRCSCVQLSQLECRSVRAAGEYGAAPWDFAGGGRSCREVERRGDGRSRPAEEEERMQPPPRKEAGGRRREGSCSEGDEAKVDQDEENHCRRLRRRYCSWHWYCSRL